MSWKYVELGSVCETGAGGTPLKSKKEYYENGAIPWLRSGEVNNRNITECKIRITEEGLNNSSAKLFPSGTVLIAMYGATAGEVGILNFECSTNQAVCGILPNDNFIPEFLYYFFLDFKTELISQAVGNAQPNISQTKIRNTQLPLISTTEQKQIVAILDKAFAAIDQAKANIEKNIQNAKELIESYLKHQVEILESEFNTALLSDHLDLITYGFTNPMPTTEVGPLKITAKDVKHGRVNYKSARRTSLRAYEDLITDKSRPKYGDVLLTKDGTLGRLGVVDVENVKMCINQSVALLRPRNESLDSNFLQLILSSYEYQKKMIEQAGGTTIKHIYISRVKLMTIPLPPLAIQTKLTKSINTVINKQKDVIDHYWNRNNSLEELKKSILQKAFSGELTSQP